MEPKVPTARKKVGVVVVVILAAAIALGAIAFGGWHLLGLLGSPIVEIETSMGTITAELDSKKAPLTVANFLEYVESGFYDETIFHRVIKGFMIQGGSFKSDYAEPKTGPAIRNEARVDMPNRRGTLAMARTSDPNSATAGFFINLVDNEGLNRDPQWRKPGYCVFGTVTDGFDVVERIGDLPTGPGGPFGQDVPTEPVIIKSIRRVR